jgi:hypothetical protein
VKEPFLDLALLLPITDEKSQIQAPDRTVGVADDTLKKFT